jgi:hypothetical protein
VLCDASTCQQPVLAVSRPVLFRPLPSEPDVRVSSHPALQFPVALWAGCSHLAYHPTSLRYSLPPFPLYRALPRSFEYYGDSVATRLAPERRSRLCTHETFSPFRCPVRFLALFLARYSPPRAFTSRCVKLAIGGVAASRMLRRAPNFAVGSWGSTNAGFTSVMRTGLAELIYLHPFGPFRFADMLLSPSGFPSRLIGCPRRC